MLSSGASEEGHVIENTLFTILMNLRPDVFWRQWQYFKYEVFCECAFQPKSMDWKKTGFFLKQIWTAGEGSVDAPTLTARNWGIWPPRPAPARVPQKPWTLSIWTSPFLLQSLARRKDAFHPVIKPTLNIPMLISSAISWHDFQYSFGYIVHTGTELEVSLLLSSLLFNVLYM